MEHILEGSHVILNCLSREVIDAYLEKFSSTIQTLLHVSDVQSERQYLMARCAQQSFFYTITHREHGAVIGAIEIRNPGHISQLYCWINEQFWGCGYFKQALRLAVREYAAQTHEMMISACVDTTNARSLAALQAAGFKKKGTRNGPHGMQMVLELHIKDIL